MTPNPLAHYRSVLFTHRQEAAAFVAALSRVLASPGTPPSAIDVTEVWLAPPAGNGVTLYLSEAAFSAALGPFAPVPVAATLCGSELSPGCRLIIGGAAAGAWGLQEAERLMFGGEGAA